MGRHRNSFKGFTLIELVLVMLVIAISAAIAAPHLAGFARGRFLPNAATAMASTARWCRIQALGDGVNYRLNLDAGAGNYWVTKDDGTGNYTQVAEEMGQPTDLPEGVSMILTQVPVANDGYYITFEPGGRCDVATIGLTNGQNTLAVSCETPTGTYRVIDPNTGANVR